MSDLAAKYGGERLTEIMQEVLNYSERMMRALLAELPDGEEDLRTFATATVSSSKARRRRRFYHSYENREARLGD